MDTFEVVQAWLQWFVQIWWVRDLGVIALVWILLQLLPNSWAGGILFDRHNAWISSLIATVIVFVVFVLPWITWQLLLGLVAVALLAGLTVWAKSRW